MRKFPKPNICRTTSICPFRNPEPRTRIRNKSVGKQVSARLLLRLLLWGWLQETGFGAFPFRLEPSSRCLLSSFVTPTKHTHTHTHTDGDPSAARKSSIRNNIKIILIIYYRAHTHTYTQFAGRVFLPFAPRWRNLPTVLRAGSMELKCFSMGFGIQQQKNHNEVIAGAVVATALWQKHLGDANNLTVNI